MTVNVRECSSEAGLDTAGLSLRGAKSIAAEIDRLTDELYETMQILKIVMRDIESPADNICSAG